MGVFNIKMKIPFMSGLPFFLAVMLLFPSFLMAGGKAQGKELAGTITRVYTSKKRGEYLKHTRELKDKLSALGGVLPAGGSGVQLPEPAQVTITTTRLGRRATPHVLKGHDFIARFNMNYKMPRLGRLAADAITANALGLPRYIYPTVKGTIGRVKKASANARYEIMFKQVEGMPYKESIKGIQSLGYDAITYDYDDMTELLTPGKGNLKHIGIASGGNLEYDPTARVLKAIDAGKIYLPKDKDITWQVPGLLSALPSPHWRGGNTYIAYSYPYNMPPGIEFYRLGNKLYERNLGQNNFRKSPARSIGTAVEVTGAEIKGGGDTFFSDRSTGGAAAYPLSYMPILKGGKDRWDIPILFRSSAIGVDVKGNGPFTASTGTHGEIRIERESGRTGKSTITAYIMSTGGARLFPRSTTMTSNRVSVSLDAPLLRPTPLNPQISHSLVVGREYTISMTVRGPAETKMGRYHAQWRAASPFFGQIEIPVEFEPQESPFKRVGDAWIAAAKVRIPDTSWDKVGKRALGRMPPDRRGSYGHIAVGIEGWLSSEYIPFFVTSPVVTKVALLGGYGEEAKADARSGPLDLFIGSDIGLRLFADVDIDRDRMTERKSVELPVRWIKVQHRHGAARMLKMLQNRGRRVIMATGNKPGVMKIRAIIRKKEAEEAGVSVDFKKGRNFIKSDPLTVTINRPYLMMDKAGSKFTLAVDGPADLSQYHTEWNLFNGKKEISRKSMFKNGVSEVFGAAPWIKGGISLRSVRILNKKGTVVARFGGATNLLFSIAPDVTLHVVGGALVQGMKGKITAHITNLPVSLAKRSVVKWSFDGVLPIKDYNHDESRLRLAKDGFSSSIVLEYPEDPATAGVTPGVKAELMLKGGKK